MFFLTSSSSPFELNASNISTWFNILGAIVLFFALLPPFFDTRKNKKTFPIGESFFVYYLFGSIFMFTNSTFMSIKEIVTGVKNGVPLLVMFLTFVFTNSCSMYMNFYSWKVKKQNMKRSAELGISEQEYWEKYLAEGKE